MGGSASSSFPSTKIVILNNRKLGMIKQWQELVYEGRHSHIDLSGSPDFFKLADAYGVPG